MGVALAPPGVTSTADRQPDCQPDCQPARRPDRRTIAGPERRRERLPAGPPVFAGDAVPALTVKIGQYPVHSGGLGAIRTLGRLGVPVYAVTEPGRLVPAAASRYCSGRFVWRATGQEEPDELAARLMAAGRAIGQPSVLIPVDDEAAVLVAEHAADLAEYFLLPRVPHGLPRELASKLGLFKLCQAHGVPAPASVTLNTAADVAEFAAAAAFPVVAKNVEAWERRRHPVVPGTTVLNGPQDLLALVRPGSGAPGLILQEYLPPEHAEDWVAHLYCDAASECVVLFTGLKVRSWPPNAGVTACGQALANPALAAITARFCKQIGFSGIADLDWRLDLRDGQYKLVDFNPRIGNQFRLFESEASIDVVRAQYLDLTGRAVPHGAQVSGRQIIVEHVDVAARLAYARLDRRAAAARPAAGTARTSLAGPRSTEFAWLAADDPIPFLAMLCRLIGPAIASLTRVLRLPRRASRHGSDA
jgi:predicted ATP-grasp superfamily ATP-dependent carboligase